MGNDTAAREQLTKLFQRVPILDVSKLKTAEGKAEFLAELRDALLFCGFFYVINHGISEELISQTLACSREFMSLPRETKMKYCVDKNKSFLGWVELGTEITYGKVDMRSSFEMGLEIEAPKPEDPLWYWVQGPNNWPSSTDAPNFKETMLEYMDKARSLAYDLHHAITETLELPPTYFDKTWFNPERETFHFKVNCYPSVDVSKNPEYKDNLGVAAHTDEDVLTVLYQDETGGLQVQRFDGTWIDVPPIPGTIVINVGDYWEMLTGGAYVSTSHRVKLNTSGVDRYSLPFFMIPRADFGRRMEKLPEEMLPAYVRENRAKVENRWEQLGAKRAAGDYIGQYFWAKQMKSYPEACATLFPGVKWWDVLGISEEESKNF